MNNKGFTLVELLAVMVILISISLVTVVSVTSSLTRREGKECKEHQEMAISAAKIYFSMEDGVNVSVGVEIRELVDSGYLDSQYINSNGGTLKLTDKIALPSGASQYKFNNKNVGESCD